MSNYNKVLLMGRLTRDPELRWTQQQTPVCDVGIAVNREYSTGNERRKETTFVDVTFWSRQAEIICQYMKKGSPIFVEGRLRLDSWEGQDGQKRNRLRVVGENFQFLGARGEGDAPSPDGGADEAGPEYGEYGYGRGAAGAGKRAGERGGGGRGREARPSGGGPGPRGGPPPEPAESEEGEEGPLGIDDKDIPF